MKKILLFFTVFQIMLVSVYAQSSAEKIEKIKQANQQFLKNYKKGNLKGATKNAHSALDLTKEVFGADNRETATAYYNLGEVYRSRKKYTESAEHFEKSLKIYQLDLKGNQKKIIKILWRLQIVLLQENKRDELETIILDAINKAEKVFGSETKEILPYLERAAQVYDRLGKEKKIINLLGQQYNISLKAFGENSEESEAVIDKFYCYISLYEEDEEKKAKINAFYKLLSGEEKANSYLFDGLVSPKIINAESIFLPKPIYPKSLSQKGEYISGLFTVKVLIDEKGDVISAKSICGNNEDINKSVEDAAMKAKFKPAKRDEKPTKVMGLITYIFTFGSPESFWRKSK